jgi:hypothetical protein
MPQFALHCPTEAEVCDAQESLAELLELSYAGELDLPPYLTGLLVQLQDLLLAATPQPGSAASHATGG